TDKNSSSTKEFSEITTDLKTVVNTVIGISKHAAYLVGNSNLATVKKLASGGGGEIFLARVMNAFLKEKTGNLVIQKIVFVKNKISEEAFYQEVGIMIMLSPFPNICRIIGFTEKPLSMILQYYPGGSLQDWIQRNNFGRDVAIKLSKEISLALKIMHSYYLAHCDLKPQNVLIEVTAGIPTSYLTDFGITQVLSEKILASRSFYVINLRGLSVHYAAPEEADDPALGVTTFEEMMRRTLLNWFEIHGNNGVEIFNYLHSDRAVKLKQAPQRSSIPQNQTLKTSNIPFGPPRKTTPISSIPILLVSDQHD
ncbi:hypothetical protein MP638_003479, partial [Amoeboaphelidium occidentale]